VYFLEKKLPTEKKFKKKIMDASRKFRLEDLNGVRTLRLAIAPSKKVHTDKLKVFLFFLQQKIKFFKSVL